jgi:hypothetical protein
MTLLHSMIHLRTSWCGVDRFLLPTSGLGTDHRTMPSRLSIPTMPISPAPVARVGCVPLERGLTGIQKGQRNTWRCLPPLYPVVPRSMLNMLIPYMHIFPFRGTVLNGSFPEPKLRVPTYHHWIFGGRIFIFGSGNGLRTDLCAARCCCCCWIYHQLHGVPRS